MTVTLHGGAIAVWQVRQTPMDHARETAMASGGLLQVLPSRITNAVPVYPYGMDAAATYHRGLRMSYCLAPEPTGNGQEQAKTGSGTGTGIQQACGAQGKALLRLRMQVTVPVCGLVVPYR